MDDYGGLRIIKRKKNAVSEKSQRKPEQSLSQLRVF